MTSCGVLCSKMRLVACVRTSNTRWRKILFITTAVSLIVTVARFSVYQRAKSALYEKDTESSGPKMSLDFEIWPDSKTKVNHNERARNQFRAFEKNSQTYNTSERPMKTILLVGDFTSEAATTFHNEHCPISECTLTLDADQYRRTADAIMILRLNATFLETFLPKPAHQIWITNHWESPLHNIIDTPAMGSYINWSSSYRHDSHITTPYGHIEPLPESSGNKNKAPVDYSAGKTKKVAWFVSNCNDRNGRKNYTDELKRHINVDIYGKCGNLNCSRTNESQCFEWLEKDYKFYLAFENSNCYYYITEKLYINALRHNVIPIVMGARRQDYAEALPPHSYIYVDDFRSPRDLADYLHILDSNSTLYNEYFRWKSEYEPTGYRYWCRVCGLLHVASEQRYVHWYTDYSQWWGSDKGTTCGSHRTQQNNVEWVTWNV